VRNLSLNYEIQVDGKTYYPISVAEFAPDGEEGRIEVADGGVKYKIRDGIRVMDEVEVVFPLRQTQNADIDAFNQWVSSGATKDVFVVGKDGEQRVKEKFLFADCECSSGKKSGFDRKSKAESTRKYYLLPREISSVK
jgi:hypothetical protein